MIPRTRWVNQGRQGQSLGQPKHPKVFLGQDMGSEGRDGGGSDSTEAGGRTCTSLELCSFGLLTQHKASHPPLIPGQSPAQYLSAQVI